MNSTLKIATSIFVGSLISMSASAQDSSTDAMKDKAKSELTEMAKDKVDQEVDGIVSPEDSLLDAGSSTIETSTDVLETVDTPSSAYETPSSSEAYSDDGAIEPIETDSLAGDTDCPEGTDVQSDGTCMIKGETFEE